MKFILSWVLLFFLLIIAPSVYCQTPVSLSSVQVSGEGLQTISFSGKDLAAFKTVSVDVKGHDGKQHTYTGVLLRDILNKAGAGIGETGKKSALSSYVLATALDQYKVVYALAEIDPFFTDATIVLAYQSDGKSLSPESGPFQIIVPHDKKHGRWIRQVVSIKLMKAS